jgi:hypothetical protein
VEKEAHINAIGYSKKKDSSVVWRGGWHLVSIPH